MTVDILDFVREEAAAGKKVALITVTKTYGSSPASLGQVMSVREDGKTKGTIGGGASEYRVISMALEAMAKGERVFSFDFDHAESGMVCGGGMAGFGNILGTEANLLLFGGGHVAQSLAQIAYLAGFSVTVVEDRPEFIDAFTTARYVCCSPEDYEKEVHISPFTYAVICTRGHNTDDKALRFCLAHEATLPYIGMIGSKQKVTTLHSRLLSEGYSAENIKGVYAPIGLDIASGSPQEIAIAIMAEILAVKNQGKLNHKRDIFFALSKKS